MMTELKSKLLQRLGAGQLAPAESRVIDHSEYFVRRRIVDEKYHKSLANLLNRNDLEAAIRGCVTVDKLLSRCLKLDPELYHHIVVLRAAIVMMQKLDAMVTKKIEYGEDVTF